MNTTSTAKPLRIHLYVPDGLRNNINVEFDILLHRRGSDFASYANIGYDPRDSDSTPLAVVLDALLGRKSEGAENPLGPPNSGVSSVAVTPYALGISRTRAVSPAEIFQRIRDALAAANIEFVEVNDMGQPLGLAERWGEATGTSEGPTASGTPLGDPWLGGLDNLGPRS